MSLPPLSLFQRLFFSIFLVLPFSFFEKIVFSFIPLHLFIYFSYFFNLVAVLLICLFCTFFQFSCKSSCEFCISFYTLYLLLYFLYVLPCVEDKCLSIFSHALDINDRQTFGHSKNSCHKQGLLIIRTDSDDPNCCSVISFLSSGI